MKENPGKVRSFQTQWLLNTLYGWLIGFVIIIILALLGDLMGLGGSQFFIGIGIGAGVGFMQGRQLNKIYSLKLGWMWALVAGMGIPFILLDFGSNFWTGFPEWNLHAAVIAGGFFSGIFQSLLLRPYSGQASWWVAVSTLAWTMTAGVLWLNDSLNLGGPISSILGIFLLFFGTCLVLGLITGAGLNKILPGKQD